MRKGTILFIIFLIIHFFIVLGIFAVSDKVRDDNEKYVPPTEEVFGASGSASFFQRTILGTDDAREASGGGMDTTDSKVRIRSGHGIWGGLRFQNIAIPQGTTISSAYIWLRFDTTSYDSPNWDIYAEDVDDSTTFTTTSSDISNRTRTTDKATWNSANIGTGYKQSVDISAPIQEVINRTGWATGNDINIIIDDLGGSTEFRAFDYFSLPSNASIIEINFTADEESQVSASTDDAWQNSFTMDTNDTYLGGTGGLDSLDWAGMRFTSIPIAKDDTIDSAFISFYLSDSSDDDVYINIYGELADCVAFTTTNNDISNRSRTTAKSTFQEGDSYGSVTGEPIWDSYNITSVVQEVVNDASWSTNSDMCIIVDSLLSNNLAIRSYDGTTTQAAKLSIMFTAAGGGSAGEEVFQNVIWFD